MIEVGFGESFIVTYKFSYRGPVMAIGLKVILGKQYVPGVIDEVESWISSDSLPNTPSWAPFTRSVRCTIPNKANTDLKDGWYYDTSAEVGDYPWSGKVYVRELDSSMVRISPLEAGFRELTVSYKKQ